MPLKLVLYKITVDNNETLWNNKAVYLLRIYGGIAYKY
jgi:hypothetical protein